MSQEAKDWRDMAIPILRKHGGTLPIETLADLTGEHRQAVVMRGRKFHKTFKLIPAPVDSRHNRDRFSDIELFPELMRV